MKLTDRLIKRQLPTRERVELTDSDVPGLKVRLNGNHVQWSYLGYVNGQRKRASLGAFPDVSTVQARELAREMRQQMRQGVDPTGIKRQAKRKAAERQTVADLMPPYFETLAGAAKYIKDETRGLHAAVAALGVGRLEPTGLGIQHVRKLAGMNRDRPATARARFGAFSRFCDHLVEGGALAVNPCHLLPKRKHPSAATPRSRVLTAPELQAIWKAAGDLPEPFRDLIRFLALVPLRRAEASKIEAGWIREGTLTLPGLITKNNDAFEIPLPQAALDLIAGREGLVFASHRTGGPVGGLDRIMRQLRKTSGINDWSLHDFRRTFTTQMAETGVPMDVTDGLLNHRQGQTRGGVVGVYNRSKLTGPRTRAMQTWGRMVEQAVQAGSFETDDKVRRIA
jgi:integrase